MARGRKEQDAAAHLRDSFPDKALLKAHLQALEEARKRDHNKLGRELEYFTTVDYIGQGLPILLPKGARVIQILSRFVEDEEQKRGYQITKTPFMAKSDLYKLSGHWDHYRDGLFILGDEAKADEEEVLALRPMTCPFQFQAYLMKTRSYRDLPLRYNETSTLFRNEASGEMHGLIRVRQFTISEGHLACTPDQIEDEFRGCLELANFMLDAVGLREDITYRFSKWDPEDREKYIGSAEDWEAAQATLKRILDSTRPRIHRGGWRGGVLRPETGSADQERVRQGRHLDHAAVRLPAGAAVRYGIHRPGWRAQASDHHPSDEHRLL